MSLINDNFPTARSWRDIPQPVKPRAMSRGGRQRFILSIVRSSLVFAVIVGVGVGGWQVFRVTHETFGKPSVSAATPLSSTQLETTGYLGGDATWLARTLALPRNATLMGLDLDGLRARLLAQGQVQSAVLTKVFPSTLRVQLTERTPVVRVMAQLPGAEPRQFLVARDGVVFSGVGFPAEIVESLPWLEPTKLVRDGDGFVPVAGMVVVADLLGKARIEAEHLYKTWRIVSLAALNTDAEVEVRTASGASMVFSASADTLSQIAKLDLILDRLAEQGSTFKRITLGGGRDVIVTLDVPLVPVATSASTKTAPATSPRRGSTSVSPAFGNFSPSSKKSREL